MKTKNISITILSLVFVFSGLCVYFAFQSAKETALESCALSIETAVQNAINLDTEPKINVTDEWKTLDEQEEKSVIDNMIKPSRNLDCYQFPQYADGSILHGDSGRIKVKLEGNRILVRIETNDGPARMQD